MVNLNVFTCCLVITMMTTSSAKDQEETNEELLDKLEKGLLNLFGLKERPKVNKQDIVIHPYMMQLYNLKARENEAEDSENDNSESKAYFYSSSNTVRSYTHSEANEDIFSPSNQMFFRFNVSSIPQSELLRGAELRILHYRHPSIPDTQKAPKRRIYKRTRKWSKIDIPFLHRIRVYDVVHPARGSVDPIIRLLDTRIVDARENGTAIFDVSSSLTRWIAKPQTNHGLYAEIIRIRNVNVNSSLVNDTTHVRLRRDLATSESWSDEQPLLVVHTDDKNIKPKEKRSTEFSAYKRSHCQRYSLYVDFRKVDWTTWIVAPPGYDAFFCHGECPYPLANHMNATNHAVIQNIIHSKYPKRVPSACCVPVKHSAISMLYLDSNKKVVLKTYQDMIVESCGCQ